MNARALAISILLLASPGLAAADTSSNAVTDWAAIVQPAIHSATAPRSPGTSQILHTMVVLAMYDAVVAIEGGSRPYAASIPAWPGANVRAAVATAAYLTARARVAPSQLAYLDAQYAAYLAGIADGQAKARGVGVGERAAGAILRLRERDGFDLVVPYECSAVPPPTGEFEPETGCPTGPGDPQPVDVKLGRIRPFTFWHARWFRPGGPLPSESQAYADQFIETRDYGRSNSTFRTAEQTDIAYFWAEHPYAHWNRNLVGLAVARGLSVREAARFFALVHTTVSDAIIVGFEAKYHYRAWRPRNAIPQADADGNPATDPDPTWTPLLKVNHPEYPSGHGFWSGALIDAVAAFFGTRQVTWTIVTSKAAVPMVEQTERTYDDLDVLEAEIYDARVWGGLHWRHAMRDGAQIGSRVASHVGRHFFRPWRPRK